MPAPPPAPAGPLYPGGSRRKQRRGRGKPRAAAAAAFLLLAAPSLAPSFDNPLLRRASDPQTIERTMGRRFASWEAGLKGFAERPVLGWGPANYMAPFGRHVGAGGADLPTNDHAHNMLVEEAATKGVAGLAAYLAIWALTFTVILRAARAAEPREQAFVISPSSGQIRVLADGTASDTIAVTINITGLEDGPPEAVAEPEPEPVPALPLLGQLLLALLLGAAALRRRRHAGGGV